MNIFFLSPSPVVIEVCEKACACAKAAKEAGSNCNDVTIAIAICCSIVAIMLIVVLGFLAWKLIDHHAKKNVDMRKRAWDVEDKERKQRADLLDKKLELLKESCYTNEKKTKTKDGKETSFYEKVLKVPQNEECEVPEIRKYIDALDQGCSAFTHQKAKDNG